MRRKNKIKKYNKSQTSGGKEHGFGVVAVVIRLGRFLLANDRHYDVITHQVPRDLAARHRLSEVESARSVGRSRRETGKMDSFLHE